MHITSRLNNSKILDPDPDAEVNRLDPPLAALHRQCQDRTVQGGAGGGGDMAPWSSERGAGGMGQYLAI